MPQAKKSTEHGGWRCAGYDFPGRCCTRQIARNLWFQVPTQSPSGVNHPRPVSITRVMGEGQRHEPGARFTGRRTANGRGDACVAPTPGLHDAVLIPPCLARANSGACANAVHICISSVRTLRGGKGKETRPGRRFCDFLCPAREGGAVCIFVSLSAPTIRVTNKSITDCCASLSRNGGGDERAQTGNMVYTPTIRVYTPMIHK